MADATHRNKLVRVVSSVALMFSATAVALSTPTYAAETAGVIAGFDADDNFSAEPFFTDEVLATGGEDGFNCYRIPALGVAPDGSVLASWDGRPGHCQDAPQPNSIVQRRSTDNGVSWGPQQAIAPGQVSAPTHGYSDPSVLVDWQTGKIFNFHVKSYDVGIRGSQLGTDPTARNVLHAAYAHSEDNGATWQYDTVITDQVTGSAPWRGRFATSGNGIQLHYGPHAGRLIQPAMVVTNTGEFRAVAWLSDDHGATWFPSEPWGTGMDENKIIELSDGTLMNNSRSSRGSETNRKISYSHDGGMTWTDPVLDPQLPDPRNNASLIRAFPNAPEGSARAKVLLFSNTASTSGRANGTIRMSCDDGKTWPISKGFRNNNLQYTSMATLPDGSIGLLFEEHNHGNYNSIHFSRFNLAWFGASCVGTDADTVEVQPGESTTFTTQVTNNLGGDIVGGTATVELPEGWTSSTAEVTIAAGETQPVEITITAPESARNGAVDEARLVVTGEGGVRRGALPLTVTGGHDPQPGDVYIASSISNPSEEVNVGDVIRYNFRVNNTHSAAVGILPSGELDNFDPSTSPRRNCRWNTFQGNTVADCPFASHTITEEDVARGYYSPEVTWRIGRPNHVGEAYKTITMQLPRQAVAGAPVSADPDPADETATVTQTQTVTEMVTTTVTAPAPEPETTTVKETETQVETATVIETSVSTTTLPQETVTATETETLTEMPTPETVTETVVHEPMPTTVTETAVVTTTATHTVTETPGTVTLPATTITEVSTSMVTQEPTTVTVTETTTNEEAVISRFAVIAAKISAIIVSVGNWVGLTRWIPWLRDLADPHWWEKKMR